MPTIKVNQTADVDFEEYIQGDTFQVTVQFFKDDDFLIPDDVSAWQFFLDIESRDGECGCSGTPTKETLALGTGISILTDHSMISISKILVSGPGKYNQSLRTINGSGAVVTKEKGSLKITAKV